MKRSFFCVHFFDTIWGAGDYFSACKLGCVGLPVISGVMNLQITFEDFEPDKRLGLKHMIVQTHPCSFLVNYITREQYFTLCSPTPLPKILCQPNNATLNTKQSYYFTCKSCPCIKISFFDSRHLVKSVLYRRRGGHPKSSI